MAELFKMEVPEIYDGIIEIKAVARDPGSRAKIAVISYDNSIDPVGACVGMRGSRVQAVVNELQGEKIDIIPWNEDQPTFLVKRLQPAEVSKVVLDEEAGKIEVVVPEEQLSLAIGRRGQNVRLGVPADRSGYRHHDRRRRKQASSGRIRTAHQAVHGQPGSRRILCAACLSLKGSPTSKRSPMSKLTNCWSSTVLTKTPQRTCRPVPVMYLKREQSSS